MNRRRRRDLYAALFWAVILAGLLGYLLLG
jgi:hypothetical protein